MITFYTEFDRKFRLGISREGSTKELRLGWLTIGVGRIDARATALLYEEEQL